MVGVIILIIFSIRISTQHFIITPDNKACDAANICNHTWVPICGKDQLDQNDRLFLDECDMFEYNCENHKMFVKVELKTCSYKCTGGQQKVYPPHIDTTLPHTAKSTTTDAMTTTEMMTPQTASTIDIEKVSSSMITEASTTASITTVTNDETKDNVKPTKQDNITSADNAEPEVTNADDNSLADYIKETTEIITKTGTLPTIKTINATAIIKNGTCYSKDCFVPSTWETTHKSELRDFYQVLKQRFGNKIKLLKDTTHFPKMIVERTNKGFIPGYHKEKISNNIVLN